MNESEGRFIFYGAMIAEGIIALILVYGWFIFYPDLVSLQKPLVSVRHQKLFTTAQLLILVLSVVCSAVLGVVILPPITSGDTSFVLLA